MKINCKIKSAIVSAGIALLTFGNSCKKNSQRVLPDQNGRITGNEFSKFGLSGIKFSSLLDSAGQWHNDYQEFLLKMMVENKITPDSQEFQSIVKKGTVNFFEKKGINAVHLPNRGNYDLLNPTLNLQFGVVSSAAQDIINELRGTLEKYDGVSINQLSRDLKVLKNKVLALDDEAEIILIGLPISITIYSYSYWHDNAQNWYKYLRSQSNRTVQSSKAACLGSIGFADLSGAINGAIGGTVLGPGGSFAGGVLGSAVSSSGAVLGCAMGKLFSWW